MRTTHNGESEAAVNYRVGLQSGRDHARQMPEAMTLGEALRRHMRELNHTIKLGPYEGDYRQGYAVGWLKRRGR